MRSVASAALIATITLSIAMACLEQGEACAQGESVIETIPWPDAERAEYVWLDHETLEECGSGTLTVERQGDEYEFTLHFDDALSADDDEVSSDTSTIVVDAETLDPSFVRRERVIDGEEEAVEGEYDREAEEIRVIEFEGDDDPRTVPRRLDDDVYYDNEASLFLWRTIRLEVDHIATYNTVLVNQGGATREVELHVDGLEEVEVPAGTFDAWKVEISTGDVNQVVFVADTPERQVVYYDNSVQIFELTSYEP